MVFLGVLLGMLVVLVGAGWLCWLWRLQDVQVARQFVDSRLVEGLNISLHAALTICDQVDAGTLAAESA